MFSLMWSSGFLPFHYIPGIDMFNNNILVKTRVKAVAQKVL